MSSTRPRVRVLIIGAGSIAGIHREAYQNMSGVELAGSVDPHAQPGIGQCWRTLDEVPLSAYDAIDVCAPTYLHKEYVLQAAGLGKPVFCEKPAALSSQDVRAMMAAMAAQGLPLMIGQVVRFFPEYAEAKRQIDAGTLGRIAVARFNRVSSYPAGWNNWYADAALSGGTLMDLLVHDFDYVSWAIGRVDRVFARLARDPERQLDVSLVTLRCANGAIVHCLGSWSHAHFTTAFEIAGSRGLLTSTARDSLPLLVETRGGESQRSAVEVPDSPADDSPYRRELESWIHSLQAGTPPPVTGADGLEAVRIVEAVRESVRTGVPVMVDRGG